MEQKYICQIANGYMLVQNRDGSLATLYTGYPYPDTEFLNSEMIYKLLTESYDVNVDEETCVRNFPILKDYLISCIDNSVIPDTLTVVDIFAPSSALASSMRDIKTGVYRISHLEKGKSDIKISCLYISNPFEFFKNIKGSVMPTKEIEEYFPEFLDLRSSRNGAFAFYTEDEAMNFIAGLHASSVRYKEIKVNKYIGEKILDVCKAALGINMSNFFDTLVKKKGVKGYPYTEDGIEQFKKDFSHK